MKPRRKRDAVAVAHDAEEAEENIPNPYYLPEGNRTNRHLLRLVRRRMIARFLRHKAEHPEGDADVGDEVLESDDGGRDSDGHRSPMVRVLRATQRSAQAKRWISFATSGRRPMG